MSGPWERGSWEEGGQGRRNDLSAAIASLKAGGLKRVAEENPTAYVKYSKGLKALAQELEPRLTDSDFVPRPWQARIIRLLSQEANDRTIIWVYDEVGNKGKSRLARYLQIERGAIQLEGKVADMAYAYDKHPIVIFDVSRAQAEHSDHLYTFAEKLKNGCIVSTKYETVTKLFKPPHVIFFSNSKPVEGKWTGDRCRLIDLSNPHVDEAGMQLVI